MLPVRIENRIIPVTESGCWIWLGGLNDKGYGGVRYQGKVSKVHRLVYQDRIGGLDDDQMLCHTCDVPCCCNPDHLYKGSYQSNVDDKMRRGRHVASPGERHGNAKLSDDQVYEIRRSKEKTKILAERYHVHRDTIIRARNKSSWKHVR